MKTQVFAVALAATALAGSSDAVRAHSRGSAEVIIEWNQTLQDTIPATAALMSPRFYAMLHIAMFDAVNAIEREYSPYVGRIRGSHGASAEAAAAQAAHDVLTSLLPASQATFDAKLQDQLEDIPHGLARQGKAIGRLRRRSRARLARKRWLAGRPAGVRAASHPGTLAAHAPRQRSYVHALSRCGSLRAADTDALPATAAAAAGLREIRRGLQRGETGGLGYEHGQVRRTDAPFPVVCRRRHADDPLRDVEQRDTRCRAGIWPIPGRHRTPVRARQRVN